MSDILCVAGRGLYRENSLTRLKRVAAAGPAGVALQEKDLPPESCHALVERTLILCRTRGVPCILHSFLEAAEALGEWTTHLPLPLLHALPPERREAFRILGASCHSVEDVREAEKLRCTYITAGHVFATDYKRGLAPRGLDFLRAVCRAADLPVWAIGGITPENFPSTRTAGARGGCVMSGLMTCADPAALLERFTWRD